MSAGRRPTADKLGQEQQLSTKQTLKQRRTQRRNLAFERTRQRTKGTAPTAGAPRRSRPPADVNMAGWRLARGVNHPQDFPQLHPNKVQKGFVSATWESFPLRV